MKKRLERLDLQFFASNEDVIKTSASVKTTNRDYLARDEVKEYMTMMTEQSTFLQSISSMQVSAIDGYLPIVNITEENWIPAEEAVYTQNPDGKIKADFSQIPYRLQKMTAEATLPEDFFKFNIMRQDFEQLFLGEVGKKHKIDLINLMINGDRDSSKLFLRCQDGILKKLKTSLEKVAPKQLIDFTDYDAFTDEYFYDLVDSIQGTDIDDNYRWICSKRTQMKVMRYLKNRQTSAGDIALLGKVGELTPLDIPFEIVPKFPDDVVVLADPKEIYLVYPEKIRFRKVTEGIEAARKDIRYYVWYYYLDFIIKNPKKMAMGINLGEVLNPMPIIVQNPVSKEESTQSATNSPEKAEVKGAKQLKSKVKDASEVMVGDDEV